MSSEKLDRDSLSRLYALAKKAQDLAYNSQNPQAVEDFNDAASPDVVTDLIDRVRELEGVLGEARDKIDDLMDFVRTTDDDYTFLDKIQAVLNKEV